MEEKIEATPAIYHKYKKNIIYGSLFFFSCLAIFGLWYIFYWKKQPEYSLQQIQKSVEEHDVDNFNKHVNIDSLVSRSVEQFFNKDNHVDINNEFGNMFVKGIFDAVKPQMVSYLKDKINSYIENGPNKDDPKKNNNQMANKMTSDFSNLDFKKISYVKKNGKISTVGLLFHSSDFNEDVMLELKMKLVNNEYWQVTEISNLISFLETIEKLKIAKLNELNRPIVDKINNSIHVDSLSMSVFGNQYGKYVKFNTTITFLRDISINEIRGTLFVKDKNDKILLTHQFKSNGTSKQGQVNNLSWNKTFDINESGGSAIYKSTTSDLKPSIKFEYLKFADGTELKVLDEYTSGMIASKSPFL